MDAKNIANKGGDGRQLVVWIHVYVIEIPTRTNGISLGGFESLWR